MIKTSLSREQNYAIALFCLSLFLLYYLTPIYFALFSAFTFAPLLRLINRHLRMSLFFFFLISVAFYTFFRYLLESLLEGIQAFTPFISRVFGEIQFPDESFILTNMEFDQLNWQSILAMFQNSTGTLMELLLSLTLFFMASYSFYHQPLWFLPFSTPSFTEERKEVLHRAQRIAGLFFRNELILLSFTWFCSSLFLFTIHFPYALLIGLLIAIVDLFPFIGVSLFYLPFAGYLFYSDQWLLTVYCIFFFIFLIVSRHFLEPVLWKSAVKIPSLPLLVMMSSSLLLFGVKGFLVIPLCFVFINYWRETKKPNSIKRVRP